MQQMPTQGGMDEPQTGSKMPWIILTLVVVVIIVLGVLFRDKLFKANNSAKPAATAGQGSGYQAVFLTNGQVYFGKITDMSSSYVTLKDIYYLQVVQPPLQGQQAPGQPAPAAPAAQPQISLVKLGNELHGPVDEMHVQQTQILFYEDLKSEGSVVKAIDAYKANPSGTPPTPAPAK
jgi:hypothetical protein